MRIYRRGYSYGWPWATASAVFWLLVLGWPLGLGLGWWALALEVPWLAFCFLARRLWLRLRP